MECKLKSRQSNCPCAFLFANGNAAFLDEMEDQICELQIHGWKGLHLFKERYPDAPVSMQLADPIHPDVLPYLLKNIIDPRSESEREETKTGC